MATADTATNPAHTAVSRPSSGGRTRKLLRVARRQPVASVCALIWVVLFLSATFGPIVAPYNPNAGVGVALEGPSWSHWGGTDQHGRDVLSRFLHGSRITLVVGLAVTAVAMAGAVVIGLVSAYYRGVIDTSIQGVVEAIQSLPAIIWLISVIVILGPSIPTVIVVLGVRSAVVSSKVIRASTLRTLNQQYIESAVAIGCRTPRILARHALPNIFPIVIVLATVTVGNAIVAEATLSFLGYGIPAPDASWGGMMSAEGRQFMMRAPWLLIVPTVGLVLTVFASQILGDALRDELDPRLRNLQ